ncbi:MAG: phospho-sugar mutase, partial [Microbacteriaceae bacterium]|nr:phospho-sugar mutase [Microbacteriaceae bacterium]
MQPNELIAAAAAWQTADPDPETGAELARLITAAQNGDKTATAELRARFAGTLEFGTAGLRAKMGAGPARINRVTIAQTSKGLANFLKKRSKTAQTGQPPRVVIGYDARHKSREFAQDTAEIMQGAGLHATLLPSPCPTPLVAFAVRELQANAGVMITASHNPPADTGYQVYLGGADRGHQIVPP